MAKIVILMGRGCSGKTRTINKLGEKLGLTKYETKNKGGYPHFITWAGAAVFMRTGSLQEDADLEIRKIFAQTGSPQEKNKAVLEKVMEEAQEWIDFLKENPEAIAIMPFTLRGNEQMMDLILQPLTLFRNSGNEVVLIYLKKDNITQKSLVANVVHKAIPDYEIRSIKDGEERQADELMNYLSLKPVKSVITHSLLEL